MHALGELVTACAGGGAPRRLVAHLHAPAALVAAMLTHPALPQFAAVVGGRCPSTPFASVAALFRAPVRAVTLRLTLDLHPRSRARGTPSRARVLVIVAAARARQERVVVAGPQR